MKLNEAIDVCISTLDQGKIIEARMMLSALKDAINQGKLDGYWLLYENNIPELQRVARGAAKEQGLI
jgi:hypothetical protein